jgi:hypothetical protein
MTLFLLLHVKETACLYELDTNKLSISPWICQFPVHHVVGKCKIIQFSVTCAMTTFARKSVTMMSIKPSGKNINYLNTEAMQKDPV